MRAFRREWRRIYSLYGFRPFGLLLAALLVVVVVADQFSTDFAEQDEARQKLEREVGGMRQKLGRQKQIEIALQTNQARLDSAAGRLFSGAAPQQAAVDMAAGVDKWLAASTIKSNGSSPQAPQVRGDVTYLLVDASMNLLPQQLIRLLQDLPSGPFALRLNELELRVSDPEAPSELQARARFEGLYLPPRGPVKNASETGGRSPAGR
jgi:hypothetical protein